jgi:hypothetical protein
MRILIWFLVLILAIAVALGIGIAVRLSEKRFIIPQSPPQRRRAGRSHPLVWKGIRSFYYQFEAGIYHTDTFANTLLPNTDAGWWATLDPHG